MGAEDFADDDRVSLNASGAESKTVRAPILPVGRGGQTSPEPAGRAFRSSTERRCGRQYPPTLSLRKSTLFKLSPRKARTSPRFAITLPSR
jgi:hypothetical protein